MDYERQVWQDRVVAHPMRFLDQEGRALSLSEHPGEVVQEGTVVSAARLNHMEARIQEKLNARATDTGTLARIPAHAGVSMEAVIRAGGVPEAPRQVHIYHSGKNLNSGGLVAGALDGATGMPTEGEGWRSDALVPVPQGTPLTLSAAGAAEIGYCLYDREQGFLRGAAQSGESCTIPPQGEACFLRAVVVGSQGAPQVQLEAGEGATGYEAYQGNRYTAQMGPGTEGLRMQLAALEGTNLLFSDAGGAATLEQALVPDLLSKIAQKLDETGGALCGDLSLDKEEGQGEPPVKLVLRGGGGRVEVCVEASVLRLDLYQGDTLLNTFSLGGEGMGNKGKIEGTVNLMAVKEQIPSGADLADYEAPGDYTCRTNAIAAGLVHCPSRYAFHLVVDYPTNSSAIVQQCLVDIGNDLYLRRKNNGAWSAWRKASMTDAP